MSAAKVYEGTWAELSAHAEELRQYPRLTLIVPSPEAPPNRRFRPDLTPKQRMRILDEIAERNQHIPALPPEAFERENLYAEPDELG